MSPRRLFEIFRQELQFHLRRPLLWVLLLLLAFLAYSLSTGHAQIG